MRIGFDAKRAFANKTGLGNYSRFVLESLLAYEPGDEYLAYTPKDRNGLFQTFPKENIQLPDRFLDKKLSAFWRYSSVLHQLKKDRIGIFHGLSNELPQGLEQAGIASVVTIHDLIFERLPHLFNPADRLIYRHKFKSACRRADAVIAVSDQTRRDLIELYRVPDTKIKVIYQDCNPVFRHAVPLAERKQIVQSYGLEKPYILSVGTLEERKNQLRLAEAFARLPRKDFDLVLVGKPTAYAEAIRDFIRKNNLENSVRLLTDVPTAHLPALYQQAEVFAYISVYEGFGIPVVEALHSGTPVLAAKGSCLEEAGGPGGLYADPVDLDDITGKLRQLIEHETLRAQLAVAGQEHVRQFDGQQIAGQLAALYGSLK
ncbi:glycosyltransferase family 4 protein [Dyadobacter sandarakinus]|uniref:Glycosyltransferase family 4 protein n=1 Tax=Dyadobacter sandarakinus TaxID=2747268 RepID=A0ABX7I7P8_9BACT|nr:glycosyltransferase family 1 protein [Dyadobacter sandarakinus]QRR01955.1 glycosyltransferase family 4 protein [Dyadobacter sandarakinus]